MITPGTVRYVAILSLLLAGCATAPRQRGPKIDDLTIDGNRALSDAEIEKKILTEESSWIPFTTPSYYDPLVWQTDLHRIARLYESHGYYQAKVVEQHVTPADPGEVELLVRVDEGRPTVVSKLELIGLDDLSPEEQARLRKVISVEPGAVFLEESWTVTKRKLRSELKEMGYALAKVRGSALVELATPAAELQIFVEPGVKYRFGEITVVNDGHTLVNPLYISEQARVSIGTDRSYSPTALHDAQLMVSGMGVFSTVKVVAGEPDPVAARIPVVVTVEEAPFHTLRAGGGAGLDQIHDELRLLGEYTDRNFLGELRRLTLRAEVGWVFIPDLLSGLGNAQAVPPQNGPFYKSALEFEQPRFLSSPELLLQSSLQSERRVEQAYSAISGKLMGGVVWKPGPHFSLFPSYNLELQRLVGPSVVDSRSATLTLGCSTSPCLVLLSYLEQLVVWDRRNDPLEPTRGFYLGASLQEAEGALLGDFTYLRLEPDARYFLSLGEERRLTFAARVQLGTLWPSSGRSEDSPVTHRFYSGGAVSMRGFNSRRLSPMLVLPAADGTVPTAGPVTAVPIGGNGLVEASFETRYRLGQSVVLAVFLDSGAVTRAGLSSLQLQQLQYAVGLGARYLSAVGSIRLDLARRLPFGAPPPAITRDGKPFAYEVDDSCFGLGGSARGPTLQDGLCVLHVSIGEAF